MSLQTTQNPVLFCLIDKNRPLYRFEAIFIEDIFNELFNNLDIILQFLKDSGFNNLDINSFNFDNYECFEIVTLSNTITNIYKFNLEKFIFRQEYPVRGRTFYPPENYMFHQIRDKLSYLTGSGSKSKQTNSRKVITTTTNTVKANPIKTLFEQTQNVISNINKKDNVITKRLVPTKPL